MNGTTGIIQFNENGLRDRFHFQIDKLECEKRGKCAFQKIAVWDDGRLNLTRDMHEITMRISEKIQDKNFIVVTKVGMPFLQEVQPSEGLVGNDRYEGFSKDLMDAIASRLKFKYTLVLVSGYGNIDKVTEKWNGMIREILDRVSSSVIERLGFLKVTHQICLHIFYLECRFSHCRPHDHCKLRLFAPVSDSRVAALYKKFLNYYLLPFLFIR